MAEVQPTNICCLDVPQDCVDYLKGLGFSLFEGSVGSVFKLNWEKLRHQSEVPILIDSTFPHNLQEFHVLIHDMSNVNEREYKLEDNDLYDSVENPSQKYLECSRPITIYDLRPYGSQVLKESIISLGDKYSFITIVYASGHHSVEYHSNEIGYHRARSIGSLDNDAAWNMISGYNLYGKRVRLVENSGLSYSLFKEHLNSTEYFRVFREPTVWKNDKQVPDENFYPLLLNEGRDCVAYAYFHFKPLRIRFVLPQVADKAKLLKTIFEVVLFKHFSDFFPDIEAAQWVHNQTYELPNEKDIREKIEAKKDLYEKEIQELKDEEKGIRESNKNIKNLLISTGDELVTAVKSFLEYLGFKDVVEKDGTLKEGGLKEEDLCFKYQNILVIMEVKGIGGTSTDSECSQIDKVVLRRLKSDNGKVHGVYMVNNQRNIEPLKRAMPPFNDTQISDAGNQSRTMGYTAQLFALYSDIENGYVSKEYVRDCFLKPGLLNFHNDLVSLGVPPKFFANRTVLCFHLKNVLIQKGNMVYYFDELHRMVGAEVLDIQIDGKSLETVTTGEVSIKVSKAFPRSGEVFIKKAI